MKLAFLILAHKNPNQLVELIKKLTHQETEFYIHIDKKSDIKEFEAVFKNYNIKPRFLCSEISIFYSSVTYIDATLILLKKALEDGADYFVFLSGQDLPIRPINEIVEFYRRNNDKNFIDFNAIPYAKIEYKGYMRTRFYSLRYKNRMETIFPFNELEHKMSFKGKILNLLLMIKNKGRTKRDFPLDMTPYYSSQWFNFNREAIQFIFDFLKNNPEYYNYHINALHPEEMFFQSIILNSPLKENTVNDNLRYIEWKQGNKHPENLDISDLDKFAEESNALFARKFNL